jgi:hypothetical protein
MTDDRYFCANNFLQFIKQVQPVVKQPIYYSHFLTDEKLRELERLHKELM